VQHRRQGFLSQAEPQETLDAARAAILRPAPIVLPVAAMTLSEAFECYLKAKARKKSLAEDERIAKHLKAELGAETPLGAITAARTSEYKGRRLAITKSKRGEPLSAASINRPLALLRCLLTMAAREWEVLETVPTIRLEQEPEGKVVWLEPDAEHNHPGSPASPRSQAHLWVLTNSRGHAGRRHRLWPQPLYGRPGQCLDSLEPHCSRRAGDEAAVLVRSAGSQSVTRRRPGCPVGCDSLKGVLFDRKHVLGDHPIGPLVARRGSVLAAVAVVAVVRYRRHVECRAANEESAA
jgi:hypothetical protein